MNPFQGKPSQKRITSKREIINLYLESGYPLMTLYGKIPRKENKNWSSFIPDPTVLAEDFPDNYGVILQENHFILDLDPRNYPPGQDSFKKLTDKIGQLPETFTVRTGGGGIHYYFTKPSDLKITKDLPEYRGVQGLSKGSFVVGPGSRHPETGKIYEVMLGDPSSLSEAPALLLELYCRKSRDIIWPEAENKNTYDTPLNRKKFIHFLENAPEAVQGAQGDLTTYKTAAMGRDFGLNEVTTYLLMSEHWNPRCEPPWDEEDLKRKVENVYKYSLNALGNRLGEFDFKDLLAAAPLLEEPAQIKWRLKTNGSPVPNHLENTSNYFLLPESETYHNPLYQIFRLNEFSNRLEYTYSPPWQNEGKFNRVFTEVEEIHTQYYLSNTKNYDTTPETIRRVAKMIGDKNRYHPVRNYIESLEWDGCSRLFRLFSHYAGADRNAYIDAISIITLVAAVARVFEPGCKFDYMPILEGPQGTGKSSFVRILGGKWYASIHIDPHLKDTFQALQGHWIIEGSEMEALRKIDVASFKKFITDQVDVYRPPYDVHTKEFPRQCIIIGTINPSGNGLYLRDDTGNRRFWPVDTGKILLNELEKDRDQLFAEAYHLFRKGHPLYIKDQAIESQAESIQTGKRIQDPWEAVICNWLFQMEKSGQKITQLTGRRVASDILNIPHTKANPGDYNRIGAILKNRLGWERKNVYIEEEGRSSWAYVPPE